MDWETSQTTTTTTDGLGNVMGNSKHFYSQLTYLISSMSSSLLTLIAMGSKIVKLPNRGGGGILRNYVHNHFILIFFVHIPE